MAKKRQKATDTATRFPIIGQAIGVARQASDALGSISEQIAKELGGVRTQRGRKKLVARVEQEVRRLVEQPLHWMDLTTHSDLADLRKRLRVLERRLAALEKPDPLEALRDEETETSDSEAVAS